MLQTYSDLHLFLSLIFNFCCETKVRNFDIHIIIKKHIAEFEISMNYVVTVDVFGAFHQLPHEVSNLRLRQGLAMLQHVHQRLKRDKNSIGFVQNIALALYLTHLMY